MKTVGTSAKRTAIAQWEQLSVEFIGKTEPLMALAHEVEKTGMKPFDALRCTQRVRCLRYYGAV